MTTMWGIHNDALGHELIDDGFVSVGWNGMGDLRVIGDNQEAMKARLAATYPDAKPGAIPVWAGILRRFAFEMGEGDLVVAPYKPDWK